MTPCPRCGASTRTVVERVFGFITVRELCAAGHSRHLGIDPIEPEQRPVVIKQRRTASPKVPLTPRVCPCGEGFQPRCNAQKYHDALCERRHRDRRRPKKKSLPVAVIP